MIFCVCCCPVCNSKFWGLLTLKRHWILLLGCYWH